MMKVGGVRRQDTGVRKQDICVCVKGYISSTLNSSSSVYPK